MRVLILAAWLPTPSLPHNGAIFQTYAQALAQAGCQPRLVCPELASVRRPLDYVLPWGMRGTHGKDGIPVWGWRGVMPPQRLFGPWGYGCQGRVLRRLLEADRAAFGKPDIIHLHSAMAVMGAPIRSLLADVPCVLTEHHSGLSQGMMPAWMQTAFRTIAATVSERVAVSPAQAQDLTRLTDRPWRLIPNPLPPVTAQASKISGDLLAVMNLKRGKGLARLLAALDLLPHRRLTVVGNGPLAHRLRRYCAQHRPARVRWLAPMPQSDLLGLMAQHKALVVPSDYETHSLVAHEALSLGLPVVATPCRGPEASLKALGLPIAQDFSPQALAQAINALPDPWPGAGAQHLAAHSPQAVAHDYMRLFESLI